MLELVFLPFLIIEGIASGIARGLNLSPPPTPFCLLVAEQGQEGPPSLFKGLPSPANTNEEVEEIKRDPATGFIIERRITGGK